MEGKSQHLRLSGDLSTHAVTRMYLYSFTETWENIKVRVSETQESEDTYYHWQCEQQESSKEGCLQNSKSKSISQPVSIKGGVKHQAPSKNILPFPTLRTDWKVCHIELDNQQGCYEIQATQGFHVPGHTRQRKGSVYQAA